MQVARQLTERYIERYAGLPGAGDSPLPRRRHRTGAERRAGGRLVLAGGALWLVVVGLCLFYVFRHAEALRVGAELTAIRAEIRRLEQENRDLEASVSRLSSMERIEREARRLGMLKPQDLRVVTTDPHLLAAASGSAPAAALAGADPGTPASGGVAGAAGATEAPAAADREPGFWARLLTAVGSLRLAPARAEAAAGH